MYFHANLDLHNDITDIENEVCVFQSSIFNYFKVIDKSKDPDHTNAIIYLDVNWNFFFLTLMLIILQEFDTLVN